MLVLTDLWRRTRCRLSWSCLILSVSLTESMNTEQTRCDHETFGDVIPWRCRYGSARRPRRRLRSDPADSHLGGSAGDPAAMSQLFVNVVVLQHGLPRAGCGWRAGCAGPRDASCSGSRCKELNVAARRGPQLLGKLVDN